MSHQFKVGDRVRLTDANRDYAEQHGITGVLVIERIDGGVAHFTDDGDGRGAFLYRLELAPPAPALIDPAKVYQTRDGRKVLRVLCTDAPGPYPVIVLVQGTSNRDEYYPAKRAKDGRVCSDYWPDGTHQESSGDLIEVNPERDVWIVWRRTDNFNYFMTYNLKPTLGECPNAVAMKRVVLTEGEGL